MKEYDVILIGGGASSVSCAEELRRLNKDVSILIISDEDILPYYRTKLPSLINKDIDEKFFIHNKDWFKTNNIDILLNMKVTKIEKEENAVFCNEIKFKYKNLVICSGANPLEIYNITDQKIADRIFYLRNYRNLIQLKNILKDVKNVVIIGSGLLGLEISHELATNYNVKIIEISSRILPKQLDENASKLLANILSSKGIKLYFDSKVDKINYTNNRLQLRLENGDIIDTDIIIITVGVKPNIDFINDINMNKYGIIIDNFARTNISNIYACGDVANFNSPNPGTWNFAVETGKLAANNLLGYAKIYMAQSYPYFLNVFNIPVVSIGDVNDITDANIFEYIDESKKIYKKVIIKDKKIQSFVILNDMKLSSILLSKYKNNEIIDGNPL
ncbi:NAD(P)/FAD-dependent oxidoreductase [Caldicellulosiruptoraceae bacterium PP1]